MFVTDNLLLEIYSIYSSFAAADASDQGDLLQKNRKKLKILIETITEQLVGKYFNKKFVNVPTALLLINSHLRQISDRDDVSLLEALRDVLQHYAILADKTYIDHKPKLEPLFRNEIRILCLNVALHKTLVMNAHAAKLRRLLDGR